MIRSNTFTFVIFLMYFTPYGFAEPVYGPPSKAQHDYDECEEQVKKLNRDTKSKDEEIKALQRRCAQLKADLNKENHDNRGADARISDIDGNGQPIQQQCKEFKKLSEDPQTNTPDLQKRLSTCDDLQILTKVAGNNWSNTKAVDSEKSSQKSMAGPGGQLECKNRAIYTIDYKPCLNILGLYSGVLAAEQAMELQQKIRRDLKDKSINENTARKSAEGDLQTAAYDGMIEKHKHEKSLNTEKVIAYGAAVMALIGAYNMLPNEKDAVKKCKGFRPRPGNSKENCEESVENYKSDIIANSENKSKLAAAITQFMAKAAAAGIALQGNINTAKAVDKVKKTFDEETADMMIDRCQFNPADPACINPGPRVRGRGGLSSEFGVGDGSANAFNFNTDEVPFGEPGAETDLGDMKTVNAPNSPFKAEAEKANGILNPAAAAQVQATGGAGSGGGGGGGGGGAGGASLGGDLDRPQDGNKEAELKTTKVSGIYDNTGGGGYKAIGKGKDDANPFASLFDQKGAEGGVEEDRSLASDDIGDKDMDLFKKISKRYGLIQADKRIEANNLE